MKKKVLLFRYRSCGAKSIDATLNGKMFFVCPLELNDPFEFYVKYDIDKVYDLIQKNPKTKTIVAKMLYEHSINFSEINGFVSTPKTEEECITMFDDTNRLSQTKKWLQKEINKRIISFKESFGIVSLTENPKEAVMWSHYASDSKGFLEVFDAELLVSNFAAYLRHISNDYTKNQMMVIGAHRVKYVDNFKERNELVVKLLCSNVSTDLNIGIEFIDNENTAKEVLEIVTSKQSAWSYEREIRLILPCDIYKFDRKKTEDGKIIHDHFFEHTPAEPEKIILGYKGDTQLEYSLLYYCSKKKITFEKSNEFFDFDIDIYEKNL